VTPRRVHVGITVGGFGAVAALNVMALCVTGVLAIHGVVHSVAREEIVRTLRSGFTASPIAVVVGPPAVVVASVFGGYLAARIAGDLFLRVGLLSAWLCVALSVASLRVGAEHVTVANAVQVLLMPIWGMFGAWLFRRQITDRARHIRIP
jgi:hypothetical protein